MRNLRRTKTTLGFAVGALVIVCGLSGCNLGNAPAGASTDEIKAQFDKLPLAKRAAVIMSFPGRQEDKIAKVKALYQAAGQTAPPEAFQAPAGRPQGSGQPTRPAGG
jgi:hypothetical protein